MQTITTEIANILSNLLDVLFCFALIFLAININFVMLTVSEKIKTTDFSGASKFAAKASLYLIIVLTNVFVNYIFISTRKF